MSGVALALELGRRERLAARAIERQAGRAGQALEPPRPPMVPTPAHRRDTTRAGALEIPADARCPETPTRDVGASGARGNYRGGVPQLWAHPSNGSRGDFQFSDTELCAACTCPLRRTVQGAWVCWGCTQSKQSLSVRRLLAGLWREGVATGAIGERVRMTKFAVIGLVRRMGLPGRPNPCPTRQYVKGLPRQPRQYVEGVPRQSPGMLNPTPPAATKIARGGAPRWIAPRKKSKPLPSFPTARISDPTGGLEPSAVSPGGSAGVAELRTAEPKAARTCQYVLDTSNRRNPVYCDAPGRRGSPYCEDHHRRCFVKMPKP